MDLQELKTKYLLLLSYMKAPNYSRQYIKHIKNESKWILRESGNYNWKTYDDIYQTCTYLSLDYIRFSGKYKHLDLFESIKKDPALIKLVKD